MFSNVLLAWKGAACRAPASPASAPPPVRPWVVTARPCRAQPAVRYEQATFEPGKGAAWRGRASHALYPNVLNPKASVDTRLVQQWCAGAGAVGTHLQGEFTSCEPSNFLDVTYIFLDPDCTGSTPFIVNAHVHRRSAGDASRASAQFQPARSVHPHAALQHAARVRCAATNRSACCSLPAVVKTHLGKEGNGGRSPASCMQCLRCCSC